MKRILTISLFGLWILTACVRELSAPPDDFEEPTSIPAMPMASQPQPNSPQIAPTLTPLSQPTPVPTFPASTPPLAFSPILYRDYADRYFSYQLLGGFQNGTWLNDEETLQLLEYERLIDVYEHPVGWFGNTTIHDVSELDPPFCGRYFIGSDLLETSGWQFAFYQGWQVVLRPWEEIPPDAETYRTAVRDWLVSQGLSDPQIQISRILSVDLEGDSVDEVFIAASYFKTPNPQSPLVEFGDYSIVLMRKVSGNSVQTTPIVTNVYHNIKAEAGFPWTYFLNGFIDLNQDGIMEIILSATRWEGDGMFVYEVKAGNIIQALSDVCHE